MNKSETEGSTHSPKIEQKCEAESEAARAKEAHDALIAELKDNVRDRIDAQKEAERLQVGMIENTRSIQ